MVGTNALAPNADIAKVQEWLGHVTLPPPGSMIAGRRPEESPTFKVEY